VRWVAEQLGHSSPMLTLKTYAHAIREEEMDLSFADFEVRDGSERLYPAPGSATEGGHENAPDLTGRGRLGFLEHETGLEPATPTLATCSDPWIPLRFPAKPPQGAALGTRA
jgi:hypothetical protein